jgi:hypothetical protein
MLDVGRAFSPSGITGGEALEGRWRTMQTRIVDIHPHITAEDAADIPGPVMGSDRHGPRNGT